MARRKRQTEAQAATDARRGSRPKPNAGPRGRPASFWPETGSPIIGPRGWLFAAALVLVVFLAYQPVWHTDFIWDDDLHLLNNPVLQPHGWLKTWDPRTHVNYWPVTSTVYRIEFALWDLNPLGYHLVNVGVHAGAALLVWRLLARLRVPGAMLAAAIFALHPVNVESAAWITQLKNTLSLLLTLWSMLWYFDYEERGGRWRYALSIGIFILATLSKGMTLTLPLVLLACAWWQRDRITRRDVLRVLPYLAIGIVMAGVEVWLQRLSAGRMGVVVRSDGLLSRAAVAGCAVWFYLGKLVWPANLLFVYPRWQISGRDLWAYLPGVLLVVMLATAWWRRRTWGRPVVMFLICYVGLLGPALGFANIYFMRFSLVADHWQYAAMIVPSAFFAAGAVALARRLPGIQPAAGVLGFGLLALLSVLSFQQSRIYGDVEKLYRAVIEGNRDCWLAHGNLGEALAKQGRMGEAIDCYKEAIRLYPKCIEARNNLGYAYAQLGQLNDAIAEYNKALEIKPDSAEVRSNLAAALIACRRLDEAIAQYNAILGVDPKSLDAHNSLGRLLAEQGRLDEAITHFRRAAELNPGFMLAEHNLGVAGAQRDRLLKTLVDWRRAAAAAPEDVALLNNLAWWLATDLNASVRNGAEAVELARRAVRLTGGRQPAVLGTLAAAYAEAGMFPDARKTARAAAALAAQQKDRTLAESLNARLRLYESGTPCRQRH